MKYTLIRSNRSSLAIQIHKYTGEIIVRAPYKASLESIQEVMLKYFDGINDFVEAAQKTPSPPAELAPLSRQAIAALKAEAQVYFLEKTRYFGALMGVMPTEIKITEAKTRWGSCNVRNGRISICYSYRTMLLENDLREYVVIHELAHIGHMNHGRDFYERIKKFAPDYKEKTERINKAAKTLPRVD